jgi:hypothetical protein
LIIWHCANHRLELAVNDTRDELQGLAHFQLFFHKICSVYSMSPKNEAQLRHCAAELGEKLNRA